MKNYFLKSFAFLAMLFSALTMSAKQYCGETMTSTTGWTGQYKLSAEKVSDTQSRLTISVIGEERITGFHQLVIQNLGGGTASKTIFNIGDTDFSNAELFSIAVDGKSAVININWTTYPTSDIQVHMVLRRNNSAGGSDIFGNTITDLNLLTACGDTGGGGGEPEPGTIDWEEIAWVADSDNKFKVYSDCLTNVGNVQQPAWAAEKGIYVTVPAGISSCTVKGAINGAGMILYLSSFTAQETEVTINYAGGSCTFWVYKANDAGGGGGEPEPGSPAVCVYEGGPGDALMEQPGKDQFKSGYSITLTLDEKDRNKIHITATVLGDDAPATTAWFQNYPNYNYSQDTNEQQLKASGENTFETTISIDPFISNRDDGIIRFAIKFAYPEGVIKVTTPEFFYLDGSGCAQRVFAIYHHDDLPAEPLEGEDQFTEYAGGKILQSIQYKRRMPSEVWETLSVPFDVDSVTAFDPDTRKHVRLYAQYKDGSTQPGNYWLREFKTASVTRENFQSNWYDIEVNNQNAAKPVKNTAYIIRLPGGGYYDDKYIVFHGRGYQTIAKNYNAPDSPEDDHYSYSGNNTMMPQSLTSAYVLDNAGAYFTSSSTVTLHPFECSVNATAATIAKMPRIALNGKNNTTTDLTPLPTTDLQGGIIYSMYGACVARFNSIDEYDQACENLATGIYIMVTSSTTTKIQIP